jgi:hypothetical protein
MHCVIVIQPSGGGVGGGGGEFTSGESCNVLPRVSAIPRTKALSFSYKKLFFTLFFNYFYCWRLLRASFFLFQQSPGQRRCPSPI